MKNLSVNELIEEYANARDKMYSDNSDYWKGVMHTFQKMLNLMYGNSDSPGWAMQGTRGDVSQYVSYGGDSSGWTMQGTRGYFVFYEGMKYVDATEKEFECNANSKSLSMEMREADEKLTS